ncbi:MAG: T9SS type A sorting domain-containing protein [Ignavibacteriota bacterium]
MQLSKKNYGSKAGSSESVEKYTKDFFVYGQNCPIFPADASNLGVSRIRRFGTSSYLFLISFVVIGLFSLIPNITFAQNCGGRGGPPPASSGTKFLLVFMRNDEAGYDITSNRYQDIYLASNDPLKTTEVTITCRAFTGWSRTIILQPGASNVFRISDDPAIHFPNQDALVEIPEVVDSTVFKVVSTSPITCYGMNNKALTSDAFLALPYDHAATDYRILSYYNSNPQGYEPMPSEFSVASFDNGNTVTIIPSTQTSSGNPALKPMVFVLDSGECVQIEAFKSDLLGDLTGSEVHSTLPVVVYAGHVRTEAPTGYFDDQGGHYTSRDHICEAMPPLSTWGKSFIVKNPDSTTGAVVRVLSAYKKTQVRINGIPWGGIINANESRDTNFTAGTTQLGSIISIESDQPILVGLIAHTANASGFGDPFLAIVPPLEQTYNDFTYFITSDTGVTGSYKSNEQYLIVATEQKGIGKISIDNNPPLGAADFTLYPSAFQNQKKYAIGKFKQTSGIHRIHWDGAPSGAGNAFTILAYGWGNVVSYGYTAGQLLVPITGINAVNSQSPGVLPGPGEHDQVAPSITVRNILAEKVYFDSAKVTYEQNSKHVAVNLTKDIALETGSIRMAEMKTLEISTSVPIQEVVSGSFRIWYHTALWTDLAPVDFPFVITPHSKAGAEDVENSVLSLKNFPNPVIGNTTIQYSLPRSGLGNVKLYDALGRMVRVLKTGILNSGVEEVQLNTNGLVAGEYTIELTVPALGINEHKKILILE